MKTPLPVRACYCLMEVMLPGDRGSSFSVAEIRMFTCLIKPVPFSSVQFSSVTQSCPTLCNPMNRSSPGLPVHHQLPEFTQTHIHRVSDAIQPYSSSVIPFYSCPPSIRVFSNESTLLMRWPKYWSFSLSIIPSKEIPGPIGGGKSFMWIFNYTGFGVPAPF